MLKITVIKEGKTPPDERVVLSPQQCKEINDRYTNRLQVYAQPSGVRVFRDDEYSEKGIVVSDDAVQDADVLLGVKEVPVQQLIGGKTYFFFSHTIKEQPYNRDLLRSILDKKIRLIDWECITDDNGGRLLGFGKFAGIVGAYNGLLTYGRKFGLYNLKPAHQCKDQSELEGELSKVDLPAIKIALTGRGRVASGAVYILKKAGIKEVSAGEYLNNKFSAPVYAQLGVEDYNKPIDPEAERSREHFFKHFRDYKSDFEKFQRCTDLYIAGHFYAEGSPRLITEEQVKSPNFNIKVIADISCDIAGPIATTLRPSTIDDPVYGVSKSDLKECDFKNENAVAVMAVDNLPCELPKDSSKEFGKDFIERVLPEIIKGEKSEMLKRATITENGKLTENFKYLTDYVRGK